MAKKSILITGGDGYIAQGLYKGLRDKYKITLITRGDFDLLDSKSVDNYFISHKFDVVINTASKGGSRLKKDTELDFYQNLSIFKNLANNKSSFTTLINFGSGAELGYPTDPYGLSKNIINDIINHNEGFHNIRIFALFDHNELDTRFIKSNIKRYINEQPLIIHKNKFMDFFYMEDLVSLIDFHLSNENTSFPKVTDCSYPHHISLLDIALCINNLSDYDCDIEISEEGLDKPYVGEYTRRCDFVGLKKGIELVYNELKNEC